MTDEQSKEYVYRVVECATRHGRMDWAANVICEIEQDTARRCAEIAETAERYGACPSCAIRREFGLE